MTTKEQERSALNKIRSILGTLDSDSWVNTAFKGVCDIAERNIEDDFADSPVERVGELERELAEYEEELAEARKKLETAKLEIKNRDNAIANRNADITHLSAKIERYKKDISEAAEQRIKQKEFIEKVIGKLENRLAELNSEILAHCENPESPEFMNAVSNRRENKQLLDTLIDLF